MSYELLSDEDKIIQAFDFVARGVPLPNVIADFLKREGLLDAIMRPVEIKDVTEDRERSGHNGRVPTEVGEHIPSAECSLATG